LGESLISGLSTAVALGASSRLDEGAVLREVVALHISVRMGRSYSVSTQIATLRRLLLHPIGGENGKWFRKAAEVSDLCLFSRLAVVLTKVN
jgi:hypothetical protein